MNAWTTLGVDPGTPIAGVRSAWRVAARRHHPDLGGDAAAFMAAQDAWEAIKKAQPPPAPSGRAATPEQTAASEPAKATAVKPWNHARAVRYVVALDEDIDVETFEDGTTGIAGADGVLVWLSEEELEVDGYPVPWTVVDDKIIADALEILFGR